MRIVICDDLKEDREHLSSALKEYFFENDMSMELDAFDSGEAFLEKADSKNYDLIFLDIYMKSLTGVDVARKIREDNAKSQIIFTTTSLEHGADSYEVDAFYYLVKPIDKQKFQQVLDKFCAMMFKVRSIEVKSGRTMVNIFLGDIIYIEAVGKKSRIHTKSGENIEVSMGISEIWSMLPKNDFCKPIRYAIVSLWEVKSMPSDEISLSNGVTISVSRNEKETVRNAFADFKWRKLRGNI
ncbi:MAG: LytTR family DNA-binding domain-containing protein [Clostridium cadaveris]|uniref:LytR/AlgR family response regulator transcription factor n=1 Tax=Clostridium cadaveris TaxID=1529 RepID=UPI000C083697|nr:LytTR family DNA-binding domain-containing protein [Clostridium cadaveris]MDY4948674.1 LytTR family DNA-binding domain-containing protein [Clostridium cadaveris]